MALSDVVGQLDTGGRPAYEDAGVDTSGGYAVGQGGEIASIDDVPGSTPVNEDVYEASQADAGPQQTPDPSEGVYVDTTIDEINGGATGDGANAAADTTDAPSESAFESIQGPLPGASGDTSDAYATQEEKTDPTAPGGDMPTGGGGSSGGGGTTTTTTNGGGSGGGSGGGGGVPSTVREVITVSDGGSSGGGGTTGGGGGGVGGLLVVVGLALVAIIAFGGE